MPEAGNAGSITVQIHPVKPDRNRISQQHTKNRMSKQDNEKFTIGQRFRVQGGFGRHSYKPNTVYTVIHVDDSDSTLRGQDESGGEGNWISWSNCVPHEVLGWDFLRVELPPEALELLSGFDGLHGLKLKASVKERILSKLPDLRAKILEAISEMEASQTSRVRRNRLP